MFKDEFCCFHLVVNRVALLKGMVVIFCRLVRSKNGPDKIIL